MKGRNQSGVNRSTDGSCHSRAHHHYNYKLSAEKSRHTAYWRNASIVSDSWPRWGASKCWLALEFTDYPSISYRSGSVTWFPQGLRFVKICCNHVTVPWLLGHQCDCPLQQHICICKTIGIVSVMMNVWFCAHVYRILSWVDMTLSDLNFKQTCELT